MSYTVTIERRPEKFLRTLTDKCLYRRLREAIDGLAEDQHPPGSVKLQGEGELYRVRVGDYRIVCQIHSHPTEENFLTTDYRGWGESRTRLRLGHREARFTVA